MIGMIDHTGTGHGMTVHDDGSVRKAALGVILEFISLNSNLFRIF